MSRFLKPLLILPLALAMFASAASARVFIGGYFGPGYFGPAYYYGPGWYGPYWGPYGYAAVPHVGKVKIQTKMKNAAVYVDGSYAGTVGELKTFSLRPGTHNIELRGPDNQTIMQQRIDVIAGKTIKLAA